MRPRLQTLGLLLLLMLAQQGALTHELSHFPGLNGTELKAATGLADAECARCPAFAQVLSPAFSHRLHIPALVRRTIQARSEPWHPALTAAVPRPRSRGPPV